MSVPLVKICGVRSTKDAIHALDEGADLIGVILVPGRKRTVQVSLAAEISAAVRNHSRYSGISESEINQIKQASELASKSEILISAIKRGPLIVGVFQNQPLEDILAAVKEARLDLVQLHGEEDLSLANKIPVPVIKRFTPGDNRFHEWMANDSHSLVLLDSSKGGTGELLDWNALGDIQDTHSFILAGGLVPENVIRAAASRGAAVLDVSGGVENEEGYKCHDKVSRFIKNAKSIP